MIEELSPRHRAVLEFERLRWKHQGAKEAEVLARFGMTMSKYFQVVNHLLDLPAAEAYDPATVRRLRGLRDARRTARAY